MLFVCVGLDGPVNNVGAATVSSAAAWESWRGGGEVMHSTDNGTGKPGFKLHLQMGKLVKVQFILLKLKVIIFPWSSSWLHPCPAVTWYKARCFEFMPYNLVVVRYPVGRNFRPVYGIGANPWIFWVVAGL